MGRLEVPHEKSRWDNPLYTIDVSGDLYVAASSVHCVFHFLLLKEDKEAPCEAIADPILHVGNSAESPSTVLLRLAEA